MYVQMEDLLSASWPGIDNGAKAMVQSLLPGDRRQLPQHVPYQSVVLRPQLDQAGDVLARHGEQMYGRLRMDILENDHVLVFVYPLCRDSTGNDPAE
jgi:hypothetical protein